MNQYFYQVSFGGLENASYASASISHFSSLNLTLDFISMMLQEEQKLRVPLGLKRMPPYFQPI